MIEANVIAQLDLLTAIQAAALRFPGEVQAWGKTQIRPFISQQMDKYLRVEPPPRHGEMRWASEKQRRFVMRKLREDDNLPYQRTHDLVHAWHVEGNYQKGLTAFRVYNSAPIDIYVYGDLNGQHQQPFHEDTGWPRAVDAMQAILVQTENWIEASWPMFTEEWSHAL